MSDDFNPNAFDVKPGLFGVPGGLIFYVTKTRVKGKPQIVPHTELVEGVTTQNVQFNVEQRCEKLIRNPDVIRIIVCDVVSETRRNGEVTPERIRLNGKTPG